MKVTEKEFISVWKKSGSPTEVAKALGVSLRAVQARRRKIERTSKILLPAVNVIGANSGGEIASRIMRERMEVNELKIENGIVLVGSDAHYTPGIVPRAHQAMCALAKELGTKVTAVILNGDILDGGQISRHPRGGWSKLPNVKEELDVVQERLEEIEKSVGRGVKLMRTYGNHCARFEARLAMQVPEYEGVFGFTLREHLPKWSDSLRIDINNDVVVIHDWHSGIHSGWNDVLKGGCSVVTGHTHELGFKAHKGFKDQVHFGVKTGMLAQDDQPQFDYRKGKPGLNWRSGFAVLTWIDGALVQPEFCAVEPWGAAYFRGKRYA